MAKKFKEYKGLNLPQVNKEVLEKWEENDVFGKSVTTREGCPRFIFFEGPPSANGLPGIHHVLARTIKDTFCRYKTMKGFQVHRKAGWDTHGLPVELGVEKELGITKADIGTTISVEDYNHKCRTNVMKFTKEWTDLTKKIGYWVDLDNPYITYDNKYIETLWWLLKELYKKGLLYKGYTIQPYSPAAGTGLSSHELNQPGCYRDVKDTTCTAQFTITTPKPEMAGWGTPVFLAWTTTPWTLAANSALCVGPKIDYVAIRTYNPYTGQPITAVLAEARVPAYFNKEAEGLPFDGYEQGSKLIPWKVVGRYKGADLVGMEYEQLLPMILPVNPSRAFRVIPGDYVTTDDGAGIVHIAPNFGADDRMVASKAGISGIYIIDRKGQKRPIVDMEGKYYLIKDIDRSFVEKYVNTAMWARYAGRFVKNAYDPELTDKDETLDVAICIDLKAANKAFKIEKHVHNYPHCWRTDKPILYYPLDSWFIRSTAMKERMSELNQTINWKPATTGSGRFGKWLENLNDWNLSRSRYWGTPLPVWRNAETGEEICIGSLQELYDEMDKSVKAGFMKSNPFRDADFHPGSMSKANYGKIDLHRPFVDEIILCSESGKPMKREADLIDVWFDSGAMPFAQQHYPFEHSKAIDENKVFPADFINEGVDQTRGWFFTLHAIATMVKDSVAFKNVISTGLVLDAKGEKMSKRLGNAINPFEQIEQYGSDAVRFYMITNSAPWDNLKYNPAGVDEVRRKFFGTLYNTYSFFALYANVDEFDPEAELIPIDERPEIDRWILSELNSLIKDVAKAFDEYEPTRAGRLIDKFVNDNLSNWYVRLNRKRFWGSAMSQDKLSAYQTLYTCLLNVAKLLAPMSPFYADQLYCDLTGGGESVHISTFPEADESIINVGLEKKMELAQQITSMVLALRRKVNIKVRQPLHCIMIPATPEQQKYIEEVKGLILNEINVKELKFIEGNGILVKKVKCNFRVMGKKFGKQMKAVANAVGELTQEQIAALESAGALDLTVDGSQIQISAEDVEIISEDIPGWLVANEGLVTVALEVELTDELRNEGMAREIINRLQNLRKDKGFEITDRIHIYIESNAATDAAIERYSEYIKTQVLADYISIESNNGDEIEFDDFKLKIHIVKI